MCVCQTAKRRRRQLRIDPRYRRGVKDPKRAAEKLKVQMERERRIKAKGQAA